MYAITNKDNNKNNKNNKDNEDSDENNKENNDENNKKKKILISLCNKYNNEIINSNDSKSIKQMLTDKLCSDLVTLVIKYLYPENIKIKNINYDALDSYIKDN